MSNNLQIVTITLFYSVANIGATFFAIDRTSYGHKYKVM